MLGSDKKVQTDTIISNKTEITGYILLSSGLMVDGKVKGNIIAAEGSNAEVRITEKGMVEGEIRVPTVIINGRLIGDVHSTNHVELNKNASITGDVYYTMMEMVMGAQVNGKLVHVEQEKAKRKLLGGKEKSAPAPDNVKSIETANT